MSSFNNNSYSNYLGARRCCDLPAIGPQGAIGQQGIAGPRGLAGFTGYTGATGPTGRSCLGSTGPQGPAGAKPFIIDHPLDNSKYLIHACLEGPGQVYIIAEKHQLTTVNQPPFNCQIMLLHWPQISASKLHLFIQKREASLIYLKCPKLRIMNLQFMEIMEVSTGVFMAKKMTF